MGSTYLSEGYREDVVTTIAQEQLSEDRPPNAALAAAMLAAPSCLDNDPDAAARRTRWAVKLRKSFHNCYRRLMSKLRCWQLDLFMGVQLPAYATSLFDSLCSHANQERERLVGLDDTFKSLSGLRDKISSIAVAVLAARHGDHLAEITFSFVQGDHWCPAIFWTPNAKRRFRLGLHQGQILMFGKGAVQLPLVVTEVIRLDHKSITEIVSDPGECGGLARFDPARVTNLSFHDMVKNGKVKAWHITHPLSTAGSAALAEPLIITCLLSAGDLALLLANSAEGLIMLHDQQELYRMTSEHVTCQDLSLSDSIPGLYTQTLGRAAFQLGRSTPNVLS